jgi:hypothetical protein
MSNKMMMNNKVTSRSSVGTLFRSRVTTITRAMMNKKAMPRSRVRMNNKGDDKQAIG